MMRLEQSDICASLSLSLSPQDSMEEACAEGISDEHYRLEGRRPALFHFDPSEKLHRRSSGTRVGVFFFLSAVHPLPLCLTPSR